MKDPRMTNLEVGAVLRIRCSSCGYTAYLPSNYGPTERCYCGGVLTQTWGRLDCIFTPEQPKIASVVNEDDTDA